MTEWMFDGDLYQEEERTPLGEAQAATSQVDGPGNLTVSDNGFEWVIRAPGFFRRGEEQAREAVRFFDVKQVGLASQWPAPSREQGTYVLIAFEAWDWELRARRLVSVQFKSKRSDESSSIRDALFGPLDSAHWKPEPQDAGWDDWWFPPWIQEARRSRNLPEPYFTDAADEYMLWYRASVGVIGDRVLGHHSLEALDAVLRAAREFNRQQVVGEDPDPVPWKTAGARLEDLRRQWMRSHGVATWEEWGFDDWLYLDLLQYLPAYRASLDPGRHGDLASLACKAFHKYAGARVEGAPFDRLQEAWQNAHQTWDAEHPVWLRDWYPEKDQINSAVKHGRDLGVLWFGPFVAAPELSYWSEADALVPDEITALEEVPDLDDLEMIGVGCVLPIKYQEADLKAEFHSHKLKQTLSLDQRKIVIRNQERHLFASAVLDVSDSSTSRPGFRLLIDGEWAGYFAKIDWEDSEAWHGYEEADEPGHAGDAPKRRIPGALKRAVGMRPDQFARNLDWDDQTAVLKDLVASVYSAGDSGDESQLEEALAAAWEAADGLRLGRLRGLVQTLDEVAGEEGADRATFLDFWKRQFEEITRTLKEASVDSVPSDQDEVYRLLTLIRHLSEVGVLFLQDEGFSDNYFEMMGLAVQSHLDIALKTPPRTPVATFYLEKTLTAPDLAPILQVMAAGMAQSVGGTEASMEMFRSMRSLPNTDPRLVALEDLHITLAELRERIDRNLPLEKVASLINQASSGEGDYGRVFDAIAEAAAVE